MRAYGISAGARALAALLIANLIMATGPLMVRVADVGPNAAAFWRLALALPLLGWIAARRRSLHAYSSLGVLVLGGLFFSADLIAWHQGIGQTKLANATLFANLASILFAVYGILAARALPGKFELAALLSAVTGSALLFGGSYEASSAGAKGDVLCLVAAVFYTLYLISVDRARRSLDAWTVLAVATAAAAVPTLVVALALGEAILPTSWTPLIVLALGSQVVGQGLLIYAIGRVSPAVIGVGMLCQPVVSATIGWVGYGETFGSVDFVGAALICVAFALLPGGREIERRLLQRGEARRVHLQRGLARSS